MDLKAWIEIWLTAEILFDDGAAARLIRIRERAHELWTTVQLECNTPAGPQLAAYVAKRLEIVAWMEQQRPQFRKWILSKYRLRR